MCRCGALVPLARLTASPQLWSEGPGPACPLHPDRVPEGHSGPGSCSRPRQAIFEILTSEFSYQHSLGILVAEFLQSRELRATMTQTEHHHLFSNILDVLSASQR